MDRTVFTEVLALPPANRQEIFRYAAVKEPTPELEQLLDKLLEETDFLNSGKLCWAQFPVISVEENLDLGFARTDSCALARNLHGCDSIVVFAATVGLGLDRLIARYGHTSPAKALMLQAIGTERIEALCDVFCDRLRQNAAPRGQIPRPRFSPGYGDLPLALQTDIFRVLDCPRNIGLTLNGSLLMSPSKSVTAIVGLGPCSTEKQPARCCQCSKADCIYRRTP